MLKGISTTKVYLCHIYMWYSPQSPGQYQLLSYQQILLGSFSKVNRIKMLLSQKAFYSFSCAQSCYLFSGYLMYRLQSLNDL